MINFLCKKPREGLLYPESKSAHIRASREIQDTFLLSSLSQAQYHMIRRKPLSSQLHSGEKEKETECPMLQLFWEIPEGWLLSNESWMLMRRRIIYLPRLCTWAAMLLPGSVDSEQTKNPSPQMFLWEGKS